MRWLLAALLFAGGAVVPARAALIAYDGFETYNLGDLNGQGTAGDGWTSGWTAMAPVDVVSGGVDFPPVVDGGSQSVSLGDANADSVASRTFASQTGNEVWFSLTFVPDQTDDFIQFRLSNAADNGGGSFMLSGGNYQARIGMSTNGTGTVAATADEAVFLVGRFSMDGGVSATNYDRMELWVNPTSPTLGAPDSVVLSADSGKSSLNTFSIRTSMLDAGDMHRFDELRIGTTAADVFPIPEPSTLTLSTIAMLLIGTGLRRRRADLAV